MSNNTLDTRSTGAEPHLTKEPTGQSPVSVNRVALATPFTSGPHRRTDIFEVRQHVSNVPTGDLALAKPWPCLAAARIRLL